MSNASLITFLAVDIFAAVGLLYILLASKSTAIRHILIRFAYTLGIIGLVGQAYYNSCDLRVFDCGVEPIISWWAAKDLSLLCFALYYLIRFSKRGYFTTKN